jgi:hypothetical protein
VRRSVSLSGSGCVGRVGRRLEDIADTDDLVAAIEVLAWGVAVLLSAAIVGFLRSTRACTVWMSFRRWSTRWQVRANS